MKGSRLHSSLSTLHSSLLVYRAAAVGRLAAAAVVVRVVCADVVAGDLLAGAYVAQGHEEEVAARDPHVAVGPAGVVDVVRAVAAARAVEVAFVADGADAVLAPLTDAARHLAARDQLARVLGDLPPLREEPRGETALAVNRRLADGEAGREFHVLNAERRNAER